MTYRIYDSMDRPASRPTDRESDLLAELATLNREAEEDGTRLTYAIGKTTPDGDVTFDF